MASRVAARDPLAVWSLIGGVLIEIALGLDSRGVHEVVVVLVPDPSGKQVEEDAVRESVVDESGEDESMRTPSGLILFAV